MCPIAETASQSQEKCVVFKLDKIGDVSHFRVTCSASDSDILYLGSSVGVVKTYRFSSQGRTSLVAEKACKLYGGATVEQIELVPTMGALVALCGGFVYFLSMANLSIMPSIKNCELKRIKVISVYFRELPHTSEPSCVGVAEPQIYLAASTEKYLKVFKLDDVTTMSVHVLTEDFYVSNNIKQISFVNEKLLLISTRHYYYKLLLGDRPRMEPFHEMLLVTVPTPISIVRTTSAKISWLKLLRQNTWWEGPAQVDKLLQAVESGQIAAIALITVLARTDVFLFYKSGHHSKTQAVHWSINPRIVEFCYPFVFAVCNGKTVKVAFCGEEVQSIDIPGGAKVLDCARQASFVERHRVDEMPQSGIFLLSPRGVFILRQPPLLHQADSAERAGFLRLAVTLTDNIDVEEDGFEFYAKMRKRYAMRLIAEHCVKEALNIFYRLQTDVASVVDLFPDILPRSYVPREDLYEFASGKVSRAAFNKQADRFMGELTEYLTRIRAEQYRYSYDVQQREVAYNSLINYSIKAAKLPLLSLLNVDLHLTVLDEFEAVLKSKRMLKALAYYYKRKNLFIEVIDTLRQLDHENGCNEFVLTFIRRLDTTQSANRFFQCVQALLAPYPGKALDLFLGSHSHLARENLVVVTELFQTHFPSVLRCFLEEVSVTWKIKHPFCQTVLIEMEVEKLVATLEQFYLYNHTFVEPGKEEHDLGHQHTLLLDRLWTDTVCDAHKVMEFLQYKYLYFERAIMHEKLDEFKVGIGKFFENVPEHKMILALCSNGHGHYQKLGFSKERCARPFYELIDFCLQNSRPDNDYLSIGMDCFFENAAHLTHDQTEQILYKFPSNYPLHSVFPVLMSFLPKVQHQLHAGYIASAIYSTACRQQSLRHAYAISKRVVITEKSVCSVCRKVISLSAFKISQDGTFVHLHCAQ